MFRTIFKNSRESVIVAGKVDNITTVICNDCAGATPFFPGHKTFKYA